MAGPYRPFQGRGGAGSARRSYVPSPPGSGYPGGAVPPTATGPGYQRGQGYPPIGGYAYGPPRRVAYRRHGGYPGHPRRRSVGGTLVGALGSVATILVILILTLAAFGERGGAVRGAGPEGGGPAVAGARQNALAGPLYRTGRLTPVDCRPPRIEGGSEASMERFLNVLTDCLDSSWVRQFGKADMDFTDPSRVYWSAPGRSPCGSYPADGAAAFYCPSNNTMYIGLSHVIETAGNEPVSHYAVYARVVAHEYGHHVQEESRILAYGHGEMDTADTATRNEISRRIELQAQCFAGVFMAAERDSLPMTRAQYRAMIDDVYGRGEDRRPPELRDHGSARHYAGWVARGYIRGVLSACNTWTVSDSAVS